MNGISKEAILRMRDEMERGDREFLREQNRKMYDEIERLHARVAEAERIMRAYVEVFEKPGPGMLEVRPMKKWLAGQPEASRD